MKIELDNLEVCKKCGVIYDYTINSKKSSQSDYGSSPMYEGNCPVCKEKYVVFL